MGLKLANTATLSIGTTYQKIRHPFDASALATNFSDAPSTAACSFLLLAFSLPASWVADSSAAELVSPPRADAPVDAQPEEDFVGAERADSEAAPAHDSSQEQVADAPAAADSQPDDWVAAGLARDDCSEAYSPAADLARAGLAQDGCWEQVVQAADGSAARYSVAPMADGLYVPVVRLADSVVAGLARDDYSEQAATVQDDCSQVG